MRTLAKRLLATGLVTLLATSAVHAQRGGGGDRGGFGGAPGGFGGGTEQRGGGRGGMDPNAIFNSLSGGSDTLDLSKVPADTRDRMNRFAQMTGAEPLPATGMMTRDQFAARSAAQMERMRSMRGGSGGGGMSMQFSMSSGQPGGMAPGGMSPGGMAMAPGGMGGGQVTDDMVKSMLMSRYDTDKDGRISRQEAERTDRLKSVFDQYDANRDGFIDSNEGKAYLTARFSGGMGGSSMMGSNSQGWGGQSGGGWGGQPGGGWGGQQGGDAPSMDFSSRGSRRGDKKEEEEEVSVLRYGKLPNNLPSWWERLDTDKDGQIGLYEWRADKRLVEEFIAMDLNGDGLLTAEEWLRKLKLDTDLKPGESAGRGGRGGMGSGMPSGGWGGSRGTGSDTNSSSTSRGGSSGGGNPFTNGGRTGSDSSSKEEKKEDKRNGKGGGNNGGPPQRGGRG